MRISLFIYLLACTALAAQQPPASTELAGKPFFITKNWVIGGEGDWDQIALDAAAARLFIAHGRQVQVVDTETGALTGTIARLGEARSVALDNGSDSGYLADAKLSTVVVFDQRTLQPTKAIPVADKPRLLVFDPGEKLLFAVGFPVPSPPPPRTVMSRDANGNIRSVTIPSYLPLAAGEVITPIAVIDTERQVVVGRLLFSGRLDASLGDSRGHLFIEVTDRDYVLRVDTHAIAARLQSSHEDVPAALDYRDIGSSEKSTAAWAAADHPDIFYVKSACSEPRGLAVDSRLERLFVACKNMKLTVWNMGDGELVGSLPLSDPPNALAYDPDRGLLFAASGDGSLTIVRRHVTDSYSVVQNLPTRMQARSMALNPVNGEVYLVTNQLGFDLTKANGIGQLQTAPIQGSFQVMVVGN